MALCVIATGWFPLRSIDTLPSQNYNEGWNAYRQWMTVQGQPLYGVPPDGTQGEFWTTNYAFLSFHLIGLLGGAKATMLLTGRVVCFASLVAVTWLVGAIVRRATGSRTAALFAGLALFAGICSFAGDYRAVDDPELLSAAFATFGLFAYLRTSRGLAGQVLAATAFCCSLFVKHDYLAFPISAAAHLVWTRNWRGLAIFATAGTAAAAALLALSFHFDGAYTLTDLLAPRAYAFPHMLFKSWQYLLHFGVPLGIGLAALGCGRGMQGRVFLLILLVFTNVTAICFAGGDGVANNIFFPPIIADLLACVIGICWLERQAGPYFIAALACSSLSLAIAVPFRAVHDFQQNLGLHGETVTAQQAIALLAATNGPAICEDLLLCYEAGKPIGYDPYYVRDQIVIGRLRQAPIVTLLDEHYYAVIQLDGAADGNWRQGMQERFTPAFQQAFFNAYRPVLVSRYDVLFLPARTDRLAALKSSRKVIAGSPAVSAQ